MNNQLPLTVLLLKHWKFLVICALVSLLAGYAVTKMIPKEYLSYAEVYANSSNSIEDAVNNPEFGFEIHADRLIQLLESQDMKDSVIQKFDMYDYYELDKGDSEDQYKVYASLAEDLKFSRNPKMAIIISAQTKDPELSADMVNYIIDIVNPMQQRILKLNTERAIEFYEEEYADQKKIVDSLMRKIYSIQVDSSLTDPLINSRRMRLMDAIKDPENPMSNQLTYLSMMPMSMEDEITINNYLFELEQFKNFKSKLTNAKNHLKEPMAAINVISRAKPMNKSIYPSMITNLLLSLTIGLIAAVLILVIRVKIKEIKHLKA
jgi:uncharacterized protein involved in exopolysaccharide biosynthesis